MMSDTPRVDRELSRLGRIFDNGSIRYRQAEAASMRDLARQLERELAEARAEIERLKQELRDNSTQAARQIVPAEMALDDATAELVRKDKLIEQMREALQYALTEARSTECERLIKAALSAAKRGE